MERSIHLDSLGQSLDECHSAGGTTRRRAKAGNTYDVLDHIRCILPTRMRICESPELHSLSDDFRSAVSDRHVQHIHVDASVNVGRCAQREHQHPEYT